MFSNYITPGSFSVYLSGNLVTVLPGDIPALVLSNLTRGVDALSPWDGDGPWGDVVTKHLTRNTRGIIWCINHYIEVGL